MAVSTRVRLDGPAPIPPRYSLRGAADTSPPPDGHWLLGVVLDPYPEGPAHGWATCDDGQDAKIANGLPAPRGFDSFTAYLAVECTPRGLDRPRLREKVLTAFQAFEDAVVEDQFWNGTIDPTIPHLADGNADVVTTGAADIVTGFALLEQALADAGQGGFIHVSPRLATYAQSQFLLYQDGTLLRTVLGTIVVPGRGYDGSKPSGAGNPAAGTEYAYATNSVRVLRYADPMIQPATDAQAVDRANNVLTYYVEREYIAAWDGIVQAAALIDPTP